MASFYELWTPVFRAVFFQNPYLRSFHPCLLLFSVSIFEFIVMELTSDVILQRKMTDPDCRKVIPRAPKMWKRTRPFKEKFVSGFQPIAPSRRSCECAKDPAFLYEAFYDHSRIGQGSFGTVFSVTCKETREPCAVKVSKVNGIYSWKSTIERVALYERVSKHNNIVRLFNTWIEDDALFVQMELCKKSLLHFILENVRLEEKYTWNVMVDMLQALEFIHLQGFVHLDVKPENILLGYDNRYKLADFDLIQDLKDTVDRVRAGDDKYRAPEVNEDSFQPHPKNDIFSLGMTLLEMAGDFYLPNGGTQWMQLRKNEFPLSQLKEYVSNELIHILHYMLRKELEERPSAVELLCMDEVKMKMVERCKTFLPESCIVQKLTEHNASKLKENLEFLLKLQEKTEISDLEKLIRSRSQSPMIELSSAPKKLKCMRRLFT